MGETEDPRAALADKSVAVRAAAARDLSRVGTFADLPPLVEMAIQGKSSALRLYAAAAAADILHRCRGLGDQPSLAPAQRKQVLQWARSYDPGRNPGLLMMLSAVPKEKAARAHLVRILRDPRNGVRAGAAVALRRMAISGAALGETGVRDAVAEGLADDRVPPDATLELIRIVGEVGWQDLRDAVRRAATHGRPHGEAAEEAEARLAARTTPEGWEGLYQTVGLDVFEAGEPSAPRFRLVADGQVAEGNELPVPFAIEEGQARIEGQEAPARLIWASRIGQVADTAALQQGGQTWWRLADKDLVAALEAHHARFGPECAPLFAVATRWLGDLEGAAVPRVRAILTWRGGDLEGAEAQLEELIDSKKKPRADLYWWLGRVRADRGDDKGAREALTTFLDRAPKASPHGKEAKALLGRL